MKSVFKIRQWKSRRRTTIMTHEFDRKNYVFKDSFDKIRAAPRMKISSLKTAAQFDQLDGKSIKLKFLWNKESFD
jgi:hypothetical protein